MRRAKARTRKGGGDASFVRPREGREKKDDGMDSRITTRLAHGNPRGTRPPRRRRGSGLLFASLAVSLAVLPGVARAQSSWIQRNPATPPVSLHAVSWTGTQLIAVGDGGLTATSSNGEAWTHGEGATASLYGVVSNGTTLSVAVGQGGAIYTGTGSSPWTLRISPTTRPLYGVTRSGSVYVAVGDSGTIVTSSSGTGTWTLRASPRTVSLNAVASGNDVTVAVGDSGVILTSANGTTGWTERSSGVTTALLGVRFANDVFVATGMNGVILTSTDGESWTPQTSGITAYLSSVAYDGDGTWVAVGNTGTILTSPDLATWTPRSSGVGTSLRAVVWTGTRFVVVGVSGEVLSSTNGVAWTRHTSVKSNFFGIGAGEGGIVVVGASGAMLGSGNGLAWNPRTSGTAQQLGAAAFGGGRYVAVGNNGTILTSTNGVAWTSGSSGTSQRFNGVRWGDGRFVAVGNGGVIATSPDGQQWTLRNSGTSQALFGVTWTGSQYIAVGAGGTILASTDGSFWASRPSGTTAALYAVRSGSEGIVAVGASGTALWSSDGATWTPVSTGTSSGLYGIAWSGERFVAVGAGGVVVTSPNGVTWDKQTSGVSTDLNAVEWHSGLYVAAGLGGVVVTAAASPSLPSAPPAPEPTIPTDGAFGISIQSPTLFWTTVPGASYRLQVALDPAFTNLVRDDSGFTSASRSTGQLTLNNVYYWRVRAKIDGYSSHWSEVRSFSTGTLAPPTLIAPEAGAVGVTLAPTLSWSEVPSAVSYHLQLATSADFAAPILEDSILPMTSRPLLGLSANTVYYWRVRAKSASAVSAWSASRSFTTVSAPPAAPLLVTPADLAANVSVFTAFTWGAAEGATSYRIQVATDSLFNNLVVHDSMIVLLIRPGVQLAGNTLHYWRVQARNPVGTGPWSPVWRFTTGATPTTPPPAPLLVSPEQFAMGISLSPTFSWSSSPGAAQYQLQISTSPDFSTRVFDDSLIAGMTRAVTGLAGGTDYYWRVRGINGLGKGAWSEVWAFSTVAAAPAAAPVLVAPAQFATGVSLPVTLSWNAVPGATSYVVQVSTVPDFSSFVFGTMTPGTSVQATGLDDQTDYYWRVRAQNAAGESPNSATHRFTTAALPLPEAPVPVSPEQFATGVTRPVTLSWQAALYATTYHVQVSPVSSFASQVANIPGLADLSVAITGLSAETDYFWRVRGANTTGPGAWSVPYRFTTEPETSLRFGQVRINSAGASGNTLTFALEKPERVVVRLRDLRGRTLAPVIDEIRPAGRHVIELPASDGALRVLEFRLGAQVHTRLLPP